MKRMNCRLQVILLALVLVCRVTIAQGVTSQSTDSCLFTVEQVEGGVSITGFSNPDNLAEIHVPEKIDGKNVVKIGNAAFKDHSEIQQITLPDSLTSIDTLAFENCTGLTSFTLPPHASFGGDVFKGCTGITTMILPDAWEYVESDAIYGFPRSFLIVNSSNLLAYQVSLDNAKFSVENGILFNKTKTALLRYPQGLPEATYKIPDSVKTIGQGAFMGCRNLKNIVFPDGLAVVGDCAFEDCVNLTSVHLPDSVVELGGCFAGCANLTEVRLSDSIQEIIGMGWGGGAFFTGCSKLKHIQLPRELKYLAVGFMGTQITHLDLPASLTMIDTGIVNMGGPTVFWGESITSLTLHVHPDARPLTTNGLLATFSSNITTLYVPHQFFDDWKVLYPNRKVIPFDDVTWEGEFEFSATDEGVCLEAFKGKSEHIIVPEKVAGKPVIEIGDGAFRNSSIRSITLTEGMQTIGNMAFENCRKLDKVLLPDSLQSIGSRAFALCDRLKAVTIPEHVEFMGDKAFEYCSRLEHVQLSRSLIVLFPDVFVDCRKLSIIDLKQTAGARYCVVDGVVFDRAMKKLMKYPANRGGSEYVVPQSVETIADYAFDNASHLERIELPQGLRVVGKYAFRKCYRLQKFDFPATLQGIGEDAFDGCMSLSAMSFMGSPRTLKNLSTLIPDSVESLKVAPEYHDDWQRACPDKNIVLDGTQVATYQIQIDGPQTVHAGDEACYLAMVTINGVALRDSKVDWKLRETRAGCMLSKNGRLAVGDIAKNTELTVTATYHCPDGKDVEGCRAVKILTDQGIVKPLELTAGWNLVAPTFQLDDDSCDKLRSMHPFGYSRRSGGYYLVKEFQPGEAFWIYSHEDMTILQSGVMPN